MSFGLALVADVLVQLLKCFPYIFSSRHYVDLASRFSFHFLRCIHFTYFCQAQFLLLSTHSFIHLLGFIAKAPGVPFLRAS